MGVEEGKKLGRPLTAMEIFTTGSQRRKESDVITELWDKSSEEERRVFDKSRSLAAIAGYDKRPAFPLLGGPSKIWRVKELFKDAHNEMGKHVLLEILWAKTEKERYEKLAEKWKSEANPDGKIGFTTTREDRVMAGRIEHEKAKIFRESPMTEAELKKKERSGASEAELAADRALLVRRYD